MMDMRCLGCRFSEILRKYMESGIVLRCMVTGKCLNINECPHPIFKEALPTQDKETIKCGHCDWVGTDRNESRKHSDATGHTFFIDEVKKEAINIRDNGGEK